MAASKEPTDTDLAGVSLGEGIASWSEAVEQAEALALKLQDQPKPQGQLNLGSGPQPSGDGGGSGKKKGWNKNWKGKGRVLSPGAQSAVGPLFGSGGHSSTGATPKPISVTVPSAKEVDTLSAKSDALSDTVSDVQEQLHTALDKIVRLEADNANLLRRFANLQREVSTLSARVSLLPAPSLQVTPSTVLPSPSSLEAGSASRTKRVVAAPKGDVPSPLEEGAATGGKRRVKRGLE